MIQEVHRYMLLHYWGDTEAYLSHVPILLTVIIVTTSCPGFNFSLRIICVKWLVFGNIIPLVDDNSIMLSSLI